jgi:hypothetical protein
MMERTRNHAFFECAKSLTSTGYSSPEMSQDSSKQNVQNPHVAAALPRAFILYLSFLGLGVGFF